MLSTEFFFVDNFCCRVAVCMHSFYAVTLMISSCSPYIHFIFTLSAFVLLLFSLVAILIVFFETYIIIIGTSFFYCDYNTDHRVRLRCNFHLLFRELSSLFSASEVLMDMTSKSALQAFVTAVISSLCSMPQTLPIKKYWFCIHYYNRLISHTNFCNSTYSAHS